MRTCLALLLCPLAASAQPPAYHWLLDESSGAVAHALAGGQDGVLAGGTVWDPGGGRYQGAARFDGVDDRIILGACDLTNGGGEFSVSLWAKADLVTGMERTLIAKAIGPALSDHIWSIAFVNGTSLRFRLRAGASATELATSPSSLFGGAWYHIAATYDGQRMRLYVNGALMADGAKTGAVAYAPQSPASLGATSTGAQPFSGWIDDPRIYGRCLSPTEVLGLVMADIATGTAQAMPLQAPEGALRCTVRDAAGRLLRAYPVKAGERIALDDLPRGISLFTLECADGARTWRVAQP
jgi:hypothetical protein